MMYPSNLLLIKSMTYKFMNKHRELRIFTMSYLGELVTIGKLGGEVRSARGWDSSRQDPNGASECNRIYTETKHTSYVDRGMATFRSLQSKRGLCDEFSFVYFSEERTRISVVPADVLFATIGDSDSFSIDAELLSDGTMQHKNTLIYLKYELDYIDEKFSDIAGKSTSDLLEMIPHDLIDLSDTLNRGMVGVFAEFYALSILGGNIDGGVGWDITTGNSKHCVAGKLVEVKAAFGTVGSNTLRVRYLLSKLGLADFFLFVNMEHYPLYIESSLIPVSKVVELDLIDADDSYVWRNIEPKNPKNGRIDQCTRVYIEHLIEDCKENTLDI